MTQVAADATNWRGTNQGTQLKSVGGSGLNIPRAGYRETDGSFHELSSEALLWSSSVSGGDVWRRGMTTIHADVLRDPITKAASYSVRCLGD